MQHKSYKVLQFSVKILKNQWISYIRNLQPWEANLLHMTLLTTSGIWNRGKLGSLRLQGFPVSTSCVPWATTTTWSTWNTWDKWKDKALMQEEDGYEVCYKNIKTCVLTHIRSLCKNIFFKRLISSIRKTIFSGEKKKNFQNLEFFIFFFRFLIF